MKHLFTNWITHSSEGSIDTSFIQTDEQENIKDNLIIKGENLKSMQAILPYFEGKIKLIYVDPPYYFKQNKAKNTFKYNTNFDIKDWLSFIEDRLLISKQLLRDDGIIAVHMGEEGQAYIKVMLNEIFDYNFYHTIVVKSKTSSGLGVGTSNDKKRLYKNVEYIHIFYKKEFPKIKEQFEEIEIIKYRNIAINTKSRFEYSSVLLSEGTREYIESFITKRDNEIKIFKHKDYVIKGLSKLSKEEGITEDKLLYKYFDKIHQICRSQTDIRDYLYNSYPNDDSLFSIEYIPSIGKNANKFTKMFFRTNSKQEVIFLKDTCRVDKNSIYKQIRLGTLWTDISWNEVQAEGSLLINGQKPERLLHRIIDMTTDEGDIVLDYFLGSGTTCAVAHKMGRQYIGIEQQNYGENDSISRLKNIIKGDNTRVSTLCDWKGGGSFLSCEFP